MVAHQIGRTLVEASPLAIIANDRSARVRIWNPAAERMFGWSEREVVGRPYPLIPPEKQEEWRMILKRRLRGESLTGLETRRQRKNGSLVDVAIWTSPVRDGEGNIISVMGVIADLTERKRTEESVLLQAKELAMMEERNRLAQEIHDTVAQGYTGIILQIEAAEEALGKRQDTVPDYLSRAKNLARESLQEARRLIWDLIPAPLEHCPLETALEEEVRRFSETGPEMASFTFPSERRSLPAEVQVALLRICQESLTNIRRHANAIEVQVALSFCPDAVCLEVKDNGIGFDTKSVRPGQRHSGFGLTGMERRVHSLGGTFAVESRKGKGTLIKIRVPTPNGISENHLPSG